MTMQIITVIFTAICVTISASAKLTQQEQQDIVTLHNNVRRDVANGMMLDKNGDVQPQAADMTELVWNYKLAEQAQAAVDTCGEDYDLDLNGNGQNMVFSNGGTIANMAAMWAKGIKHNPGYLPCSVNNMTSCFDHDLILGYTQLVWSRTYKIGCGIAECDGWRQLLCRYKTSGNIWDEFLYKVGEPCSACADGQTCKDGLCSGDPQPLDCDSKESYQCERWHAKGHCRNPDYIVFMESRCPQICGFCEEMKRELAEEAERNKPKPRIIKTWDH